MTGSSLFGGSPDYHFGKDDQVYVVVTPYDGVEYGLPTPSSMRTISDSPMSSPEISIGSPNDPPVEGEDDLVCLVIFLSIPIRKILWNIFTTGFLLMEQFGCSNVCRNR